WCDDDRRGREALSGFCKFPTRDGLGGYRVFGAESRRTVGSSKRGSWRAYVSNLNCETPIGGVWDVVGGISGGSRSAGHRRLNAGCGGGAEAGAASKGDIAGALGDAFGKDSSNRHCPEQFQGYQGHRGGIKLGFKSSSAEECNTPFDLDELEEAINGSHDAAAGPDEVHYQVLERLPTESLQALLDMFGGVWEAGNFPEGWELAAIVPVPEPGRDHAEPANYRPVALTSCLCGALERVINKRLVWCLEFGNLVSPVRSGFRSERGTNDGLMGLEAFIRDAFVGREHVVAVFFDLEVWHFA
ncbi:MAG: hypothetical protein LPH21_07880, partial [Shewanella sp.]|nr:hypothetical protein [Shewanella sp.]